MFKFFEKTDSEAKIERMLSKAYPGAEILRFESTEGRSFHLDGVFALLIEGDTPHWLVVSRGLTKLLDERGDDLGPRFELTCRLPARIRDPGEDFGWIVSWMQGLADYLAESGASFEPFHQKKMLNGDDDSISGLVFVADVVLPALESGKAKVSFLQMVGLTTDELRAMQTWQARPFVDLIRTRNPLLLTHPRASLLGDADFASQVEEGSGRDGSSMGVLSSVELFWLEEADELQVHLSPNAIEAVRFGLLHRLRHGQRLVLFGDPRIQHRDERLVQHAPVNALLVPEDGPSGVEEHGGMKLAVLRIPKNAIEALLDVLHGAPGSQAIATLPGVRFVSTTRERLADPNYPRT
jgi:suppressor of fused-like protein